MAPGAAGKAARGRGPRPGLGDSSPVAQRSAAGGGRSRARGARHSLLGEIGARPVGDWAGPRGPERGATERRGRVAPPPGTGPPPGRPPGMVGVGGAAGRVLPRGGLRRRAASARFAPRRWGHGLTPCSPRTPAGRTRAQSARRGALLPLARHPFAPRTPLRGSQALPSCASPGGPRGGNSPGAGTDGGVAMHERFGAVRPPPALAVKPSAFPWEVLRSHPEAGRRSRRALGTQRGSAGHAQHPLSHPEPL